MPTELTFEEANADNAPKELTFEEAQAQPDAQSSVVSPSVFDNSNFVLNGDFTRPVGDGNPALKSIADRINRDNQQALLDQNPPRALKEEDLLPQEALRQVPLRTVDAPQLTSIYHGDTQPQPITNPNNEISSAERFAKTSQDFSSPIVPLPKFKINPDDNWVLAVGKEALNILIGIPEFIESPAGILTLGAGGVAPKTVSALFSADMAKSTGEQILNTYKNWGNFTPSQKAAAITDIVGTGAFSALTAKHALSKTPAEKLGAELNRTEPNIPEGSVARGGSPLAYRETAAPNLNVSPDAVPNVRQAAVKPPAPDVVKSAPSTGALMKDLTPEQLAKSNANNSRAAFERVQAETEAKKSEFIKSRIPELTPESVRLVVNKDSSLPKADYVQVDEFHAQKGNVFSSNPEQMNKLGFEMPSKSELLKLPQGKYTLAEAIAKLAEMSKSAEPTVTLYRGQDHTSPGGQFWSEDVNYATKHSDGKNVQTITVPKSVADAARAAAQKEGTGTPGSHILPPDIAKNATPMPADKIPNVVQDLTPNETTGAVKAAPELMTPGEAKPAEMSIASDWTSATKEPDEAPSFHATTDAADKFNPNLQELHSGIPIPKFKNRKMSELDAATTDHSAKIQKSYDEAGRIRKEIKKVIPSARRQSAVSVWIEAKGDVKTLSNWAAAAKEKVFRRAVIDAQTLTPEEIGIARKAIATFDVLKNRGIKFDVLKSFRENYVPHIWDVKKPGTGFGMSMLKERFKFSKARTFENFFEGDQAGFKPKTLEIGKLLPAYTHEMNVVIADRQFVRNLVKGMAKDGLPLAVPRGSVKEVENPGGKAVLVQPKTMREADTGDYKLMSDQPALSGWTWEGKDTDGNPVFVKADLALHPEAYRRLHSILGQSALRQWARDSVSGTAQIPRAIVRGIDTSQKVMKREMFGLLAPFHQVQEGTHAVGHLVNPFFGIPKIDLRLPDQMDAANHGLMLLPDKTSSGVYLEGVGAKNSSFLSKGLRKVGAGVVSDVIDGYQDYLFHQYIPGLKLKTYEAMVARNTKLYAKELASGEMSPADVKITSAEQANAAYGHLNYALLDRNPTIQHMMQLGLLAPDFLEARARFVGQAFKGLSSKVGVEQMKAIAILAAVQVGSAFVLSNLLGTPYDPKHPFEVIYKGRRFTMRSVPEDIFNVLKDTRQFVYSRVNPLVARGGIQLATGKNYRGESVTTMETLEELLAGYIPITARQIPGLRTLTETGRNNPVSPLQQLAGSLGLRISRYSPISETYKLAGDWMDKNKMARDRGSYPVSKYQQLRYALEDGDLIRAKSEYDALVKSGMKPDKISTGFKESITHPFTGTSASDAAFVKTLSGYDKELYDQAMRTKFNILKSFESIGVRKPVF